MLKFLINQINQICEGDIFVLKRKVKNLFFYLGKFPIDLALYTLAIPIVVIIRLAKPFKLIRFGEIRSDVIGHAVFDPEYYLSEKDFICDNSLDLFFFQTIKHPNSYWPIMLKRHLNINSFYYYLYIINRIIPFGKSHEKKNVHHRK